MADSIDDLDAGCLCQDSGVIDLLGQKYTMQVVCIVGHSETVRFNVLENYLSDASSSTLSRRLEDLSDAGLISRTMYDEIPPRVEYELTEDGRELQKRLVPIVEWSARRESDF